jgi:hypothetical protein
LATGSERSQSNDRAIREGIRFSAEILQEGALRNLRPMAASFGVSKTLPLFKIALVLVRLDDIASRIVNANHGIM